MSEKNEVFEGHAILELMGHRRLAGYVREQEVAGVGMLRIDVPATYEQGSATQFYSPQAVYCITPTTEEIVQAVAERSRPEPVSRWELRQIEPARGSNSGTREFSRSEAEEAEYDQEDPFDDIPDDEEEVF